MSTVVIGNGLIANSFKENIDFDRSVLVLASGVSNARETKIEEFQRESDLIKRKLVENPGHHVIYFSSCSVTDGVCTPYTTHKQEMESLVSSEAKTFHVFRLPQVVGLVSNRTLVSHFVKSILTESKLVVQARSTRSILDVKDLLRVVSLAIDTNIGAGTVQNIASLSQVPVVLLVNEIAHILEHPARIEIVPEGCSSIIEMSFLNGLLPPNDPLFEPHYWRRVLRHYVPLIAAGYSSGGLSH